MILTPERIIHALRGRRLSVGDEKRLQGDMADVFVAEGIEMAREYRLDSGSIIDFFGSGIGAEVKLRGSKREIYRQLERYAGFAEIEQLMLVTNVPMGLPKVINGKPVFLFNLSRAWL